MRLIFLLLFVIVDSTVSLAQNVPIGQWEARFSYNSAQHVVSTAKKIFCSTYNGLFSINPIDKKITILSKANGLNDVGISSMSFDSTNNMLVLAYRSGNIDLLTLDGTSELIKVNNLPVLMDLSNLQADRQINPVVFHQNLAYLGTSYGIVVVDTKLKEVKETYRFIGSLGTEVEVKDIAFSNDSLFAVTSQGLIGASMKPSVNRQYFQNWKTISTPVQTSSIIFRNDILYAGAPGQGIFKRVGGKWSLLYQSTSNTSSLVVSQRKVVATLKNEIVILDQSDNITSYKSPMSGSLSESIFSTANTLWVADRQLGLLENSENLFQSFSPVEKDTTIVNRPDSAVIDPNGLLWSRLPTGLNGGISITDSKTGKQRFLSASAGNGGLPSQFVNSVVVDTDGLVWFACNKGVGYFSPYEAITTPRLDAILPIFGQRKLLSSEVCTTMAVEAGNRKWIGTKKGLYLFNEDGTELIDHFTKENSPLPSDEISALEFQPETGLLFVETPNGMVSYRTHSSRPAENFSAVTIFPNPVRPNFTGNLGIKGLTDNCTVKITSLSGRLIYETNSEGGTASWNLQDYSGRRAAGGIYIVMTISEDKSAKFVGKFAIID